MTPEEQSTAVVEDLARKVFNDDDISKADPQTFHRAVLFLKAKTDKDWAEILAKAIEGDEDASRLIGFRAGTMLTAGEQLPPLLAHFVAEILFKRFYDSQPGNPNRLHKRNLFIVRAVTALDGSGLDPTRNRSLHGTTGNESRCSIVTKALHQFDSVTITESAVEKVWEEWVRNSSS